MMGENKNAFKKNHPAVDTDQKEPLLLILYFRVIVSSFCQQLNNGQ
jgi:hypothetical protein